MSYYPSGPYTPPQYDPRLWGYDPSQQILRPARRAGIALIIAGALALLCGGCFAFVGAAMQFPEVRQEVKRQDPSAEIPPLGLSLATGLVQFACGGALLAAAAGTMRASRAAIRVALAATIVLAIDLAVLVTGLQIEATRSFRPEHAIGLAFSIGVVVAPLALVVILLILARRAAPAAQAMQQWQQQYWYAMQMQWYNQWAQGGAPGATPIAPRDEARNPNDESNPKSE